MTNPAFTQVTVRSRNDNGTEADATWRQNENVNDNWFTGTNYRARFRIDETAARSWTNKTWNLRYSHNGGAYTAVSATSPIQFAASGNFADGADCTAQLTGGTGNFVTDNNGMKEATGGAGNSGGAGELFETEICLQIDTAQVSSNDTFALRIYDGTSAIAAYTNTLTITAKKAYTLAADSGAFALSGTAATLKVGHKLTADSGSFVLTGGAATLTKGYPLAAASGSFALTGGAADLRVDRKLTADGGSLALSGTAAILKVDRKITADSGAFAITGGNATLLVHRVLNAEGGTFTLAGGSATLLVDRKITADSGAFTLTGGAATLTYTQSATPATRGGDDAGSPSSQRRKFRDRKSNLREISLEIAELLDPKPQRPKLTRTVRKAIAEVADAVEQRPEAARQVAERVNMRFERPVIPAHVIRMMAEYAVILSEDDEESIMAFIS